MVPIAPGQQPVFTATPVPAGLVPTTPPTWDCSDAVITLSVDPTGLIATASIPANVAVGATFTLTISYTNPDGTAATGSTSQTVVSPTSPDDITGFTIEQTA